VTRPGCLAEPGWCSWPECDCPVPVMESLSVTAGNPVYDPGPVPEDGDGAELLDEVRKFLCTYVAFPSEAAGVAVTLWTVHAHAAGAAETGEASIGVRLLSDLREAFSGSAVLSTAEILDRLCKLEEAPWHDLRGKPLDPRGLASRLRQYEVRSTKVKIGDRALQGYRAEDLHDAWSRYLAPVTAEAEPPEPPEPGWSEDTFPVPLAGEVPEPEPDPEPGDPPVTCDVPQVPQVPAMREPEPPDPKAFGYLAGVDTRSNLGKIREALDTLEPACHPAFAAEWQSAMEALDNADDICSAESGAEKDEKAEAREELLSAIEELVGALEDDGPAVRESLLLTCTACGGPLDPALIKAGFTTHGEDEADPAAEPCSRCGERPGGNDGRSFCAPCIAEVREEQRQAGEAIARLRAEQEAELEHVQTWTWDRLVLPPYHKRRVRETITVQRHPSGWIGNLGFDDPQPCSSVFDMARAAGLDAFRVFHADRPVIWKCQVQRGRTRGTQYFCDAHLPDEFRQATTTDVPATRGAAQQKGRP